MRGLCARLILLHIFNTHVVFDLNHYIEELLPVFRCLGFEGVIEKVYACVLFQGGAVKGCTKILYASDYGLHGDQVYGAKDVALGTNGGQQDSGSGS